MYLTTSHTRESIRAVKGQVARKAEQLLASHPHAETVCLANYGGRGTVADLRAAAGPRAIIYVRSTGGRWGRSRKIILPR